MKKMKKIIALLIAMVMVLGMSTSVFAASISVTRDSTYAGEQNEAGRTFTYKQIFHATLSAANTSTGGGYDEDGTPGSVTASLAKGYSYYLNSPSENAQIAQLGTWVAATETTPAHWEKATGNLWFDLTPSADGSQYIVSWATGVATDTDTAQAAAKWLAGSTGSGEAATPNYTPVKTGSLTWDATAKAWTATGLEDGYYLLSSDTGDNLVAATGNIQITEKNSYPPLDKTQADEDDEDVVTDQSNANRKVAVGDILSYQVKVTIPATAAVGEKIKVYDAPSAGLSYNSDSMKVTVDGNEVTPAAGAVVAPITLQTGDAWRYEITVDANNKGKDVIFSFTMTVTAAALEDPDKLNPSGLIYNDYNSIPDEVKFETYYAGIHKIDGETKEDLSGVKFDLFEKGVAFNVTKTSDGYYIPGGNSNEVVTDTNGMIMIRGLDDDKTYTLKETETKQGYNLLADEITLTLHLDTVTKTTTEGETTTISSFENAAATDWGTVENNKGTVLPSTGGIGTTIFYIVGAILVIGAGVVLVTRRRMNAD